MDNDKISDGAASVISNFLSGCPGDYRPVKEIIGGLNKIEVVENMQTGKKFSYITPKEFRDTTGNLVKLKQGEHVFNNPVGVLSVLKAVTQDKIGDKINWFSYIGNENYSGHTEQSALIENAGFVRPLKIHASGKDFILREYVDGDVLKMKISSGDYKNAYAWLDMIRNGHKPVSEGGIGMAIGDRGCSNTIVENSSGSEELRIFDFDINIGDCTDFEVAQAIYYMNWFAKDSYEIARIEGEFVREIKYDPAYNCDDIAMYTERFKQVFDPVLNERNFKRFEYLQSTQGPADLYEKAEKYRNHVDALDKFVLSAIK